MTKKKIIGLTSALTISGSALAEPPAEVVSGAGEREAVAITIYNEDMAMVKERRKVKLPAGISRLSLRDVSARIKPETALLYSLGKQPLTLIEQNFDFDLLTPAKLLEKYVGKDVTVIFTNPATGAETREKATVLSSVEGTVLKFADRIETGVPGRIAFGDVPAMLRDRPTLSVLLDNAGGEQSVELSYLTHGFTWRADYVASLESGGKHMNLSAWVTLTNQSGTAFDNVRLQLVAGEVNTVRSTPMDRPMMAEPRGLKGGKLAPQEETLMDYHLYTFDHPTSIAHKQTKQLALLSADKIPVQREYVLGGSEHYYRNQFGMIGKKLKPWVFVGFENKGGQLGKPLPEGIMRVYAKDREGSAQFVGEDRIAHTAKNEWVRLKLGEAFDITAEREQTNFAKISDKVFETAYRIEVRNAKEEAVTVRIMEPVSSNWEILKETHPNKRENSRFVYWSLDIPANGKTTLEYNVRARW